MEIFINIAIILTAVAVMIYICHKLSLPPITGLLLAGVILGPHVLGLIGEVKEVEILAEVGVILLLFTIGLEFSFAKLLTLRKEALIGGPLQVFITVIVCFILVYFMSHIFGLSLLMACLVSLSSTAIVLNILQSLGEMSTRHGRFCLGVLIFQDIIVVAMMLMVPFLDVSDNTPILPQVGLLLAKTAGLLFFTVIASRYIIPRLFLAVARTRDTAYFLLIVLLTCFSVASITYMAGLSLSLGAFLAGVVIAESDYSHEALVGILPFREIFTGFFFISIGMLLDMSFVIDYLPSIALAVLIIVVLKSIIASVSGVAAGLSLPSAVAGGIMLSQVGEFAFVLARSGLEHKILDAKAYQFFLAIAVITLFLTPLLFFIAKKAEQGLMKLPLPEFLQAGFGYKVKEKYYIQEDLTGHIIVIGYGLTGQQIVKAAKKWKIPYVIIELNPDTVARERANGEEIFFGNAAQGYILRHAKIEAAQMVVVSVPDSVATGNIVRAARAENPFVQIIARTPYTGLIAELKQAGADMVVANELVASYEVLYNVLVQMQISRETAESFVRQTKDETHHIFSPITSVSEAFVHLQLPDLTIWRMFVQEGSPFMNKTLIDLDLRNTYGVTVVALRRDEQDIFAPSATELLKISDTVYVAGKIENLEQIKDLFTKK